MLFVLQSVERLMRCYYTHLTTLRVGVATLTSVGRSLSLTRLIRMAIRMLIEMQVKMWMTTGIQKTITLLVRLMFG